ncbi:MAG: hypothetical protein H6625_06525 [Bdellovibrionaceae bacterium]|nr:hypothetical protein [Pseudobdellovibrionaceae bacterium]
MKFKLLYLILLLPCQMVFAQPKRVIGLGVSSRLEKEADSKYYNAYDDYSLFAQVQSENPKWFYLLELHYLVKETSEGDLSVKYSRLDLNPGVIYDFNPERNWRWFVGSGLGLSQERVQMKITNTDSDSRIGDFVYTLNAQGGVFKTFFEVLYSSLSLDLFLPIFREERDTEVAITLRWGYSF